MSVKRLSLSLKQSSHTRQMKLSICHGQRGSKALVPEPGSWQSSRRQVGWNQTRGFSRSANMLLIVAVETVCSITCTKKRVGLEVFHLFPSCVIPLLLTRFVYLASSCAQEVWYVMND